MLGISRTVEIEARQDSEGALRAKRCGVPFRSVAQPIKEVA